MGLGGGRSRKSWVWQGALLRIHARFHGHDNKNKCDQVMLTRTNLDYTKYIYGPNRKVLFPRSVFRLTGGKCYICRSFPGVFSDRESHSTLVIIEAISLAVGQERSYGIKFVHWFSINNNYCLLLTKYKVCQCCFLLREYF